MTERPLRVAIFSDSALPILNGVSVSIALLIEQLRQRGHSVHLFTAANSKDRCSDPNTLRFPAIQTPWTKDYPIARPPFYPMLGRFRHHQYDLIHTHTPFTIGFVGLRWAESHGIPCVSTYHTLYDKYSHYIPFFPKRYVRYKIAKHTNFYYNSVSHVITPSEASKKWLLRHSVNRPISVIPTVALSPRMLDRAETRRRLGIPANRRVLLYVGRIAQEKNLHTLFDAVKLAFERDPSLLFWLVGDGPYRASCTEYARNLGIGDRVHFVGFVPRNEVDDYYAAADLFVFSSMTETQGLVVSEAMSYGLPAVVVSGGGASAAVENDRNGFVVKNDPAVFSESILSLMTDERLYMRISENAKHTARAYSADAMTDQVLEIYRSVCGEHLEKQAPFRWA